MMGESDGDLIKINIEIKTDVRRGKLRPFCSNFVAVALPFIPYFLLPECPR